MTADQLRESHAHLVDRFTYDPEDGHLRYRRDFRKKFLANSIAGYIDKKGYWRIAFEGKLWKSHRLIWFYVYGELPKKNLDHINGCRNDNRIVNLREASISENGCNTALSKFNTSGHKGVSFHAASNSWCACVIKQRNRHRIVGFKTKNLAADFISLLRPLLHGEFAREF